MSIFPRFVATVAATLALSFTLTAADASRAAGKYKETALDKYVWTPDPSYKWELVKTIPGQGYTGYILDLTSQTWVTPVKANSAVWRHWLIIVKPDKVTSSTGHLYITGGSQKDKVPEKIDPVRADMAITTGAVVSELKMVPNQPMSFEDHPQGMVEDDFIAYTWDKYLRTGDSIWPARLPMTKSAVKAMDAITEFTASEAGGKVKVDTYVVAGGSKRGWTTWTTAAVDKRVIAIEPIVIDMLNIEPSFDHHWRAYGFWAPAVGNYTQWQIMDWNGTKEYKDLMKIVEPFSYRERLTMPKYIVNSAGDQFFLPDSSQFYFDQIYGEKYLRYVPNSDHSLRGTDAAQTNTAYYDAVIHNFPRPKFDWKFEKDGSIRVHSQTKPTEVKVWVADNPNARDFRLMSIGPAYKDTVLKEDKPGVYVARIPKPEKGYRAYFVEMTYPSNCKYPFKFTTAVRISPDTLPFPSKTPVKPPATQPLLTPIAAK
ncbi:MAG: PhoPQ-activated pathogenicity-related family protein [Bryobacteraceae bacterium]